jgi:hypothetical protein
MGDGDLLASGKSDDTDRSCAFERSPPAVASA